MAKEPGPRENLLIVEGDDDFHVIKRLVQFGNLSRQFRIETGDGYEAIHGDMDTTLDETGLERIGFVVDADLNLSSRWQSLRDRLISCGYESGSIPLLPQRDGTIFEQNGKVRVGLWLMPNNDLPGALEEFARLLIPEEDSYWDYAVQCVRNLPLVPPKQTDNWISKANIHTWLAWQEEPGKPISSAITKRYLNPEHRTAEDFLKWLRRLFDL